MFLLPDSPLDSTPLQINPLSGEETILNKSIFSCLTSGKGLTDLLKNLAEFSIVFPSITSQYYDRVRDIIIPALDLGVKSCEESLKLSTAEKIVGIDGAWSAPRNARYCIVELIDCQTKKIIDFQFISSINLQIEHSHFTFTSSPPNLFEYLGVSAMADRHALRENTKIFAHDGDVKIKDLLINVKGLKIQEVLDTNHKAKSLFYSAANQNSPLAGLYKILRSTFIHVVQKYPPELRFEKFVQKINKATGPDSQWKKRDNPVSKEALQKKILETKEILPRLNPIAHTIFNESFHSLKNHFAPKSNKFKRTWIPRVVFALIEWNHPTSFLTIIRNFLQAPPPTERQSIAYLKSLHEKKMYDYQRRQDPIQKEITKRQKYSKQPSSFTSPIRHKLLDEELPKEKMTKRALFPKSSIDLGTNWKKKIYFVKTETKEGMSDLLLSVEPPIYRLSVEGTAAIIISKTFSNTKIDSFAFADKGNLISYYLLTDDNFLDAISIVNGGVMVEDPTVLEIQKAKSQMKMKCSFSGKKASKFETRAPSPEMNQTEKPVFVYTATTSSLIQPSFELNTKKSADVDPIDNEELASPITEPQVYPALIQQNADVDDPEDENINEMNPDEFVENIEEQFNTSSNNETFLLEKEELQANMLQALYNQVECQTEEEEFNETITYDLPCGEEYPFDTWPPLVSVTSVLANFWSLNSDSEEEDQNIALKEMTSSMFS